jgi:hypothetical protein
MRYEVCSGRKDVSVKHLPWLFCPVAHCGVLSPYSILFIPSTCISGTQGSTTALQDMTAGLLWTMHQPLASAALGLCRYAEAPRLAPATYSHPFCATRHPRLLFSHPSTLPQTFFPSSLPPVPTRCTRHGPPRLTASSINHALK